MSDFSSFLKPGYRAHLIGIGGVSMSPLAEVLASMGIIVSGSDALDSDTVKNLRRKGFTIAIGHHSDNIRNADFVIRTAAAHDNNPEVIAARNAGVPVFARAQAWGVLMRGYKTAICVAGTHGKTTTTSMLTHILMAANRDPTVMLGGTLPLLRSGYRIGSGDTIVLESDEYYNSFHSFTPSIAVILNVDADHPDFFSGIDDIKASFRKFADSLPPHGFIIANQDDLNTISLLEGLSRNRISFGIDSPLADLRASAISAGRLTEFDVLLHNSFFAHISLQVPGIHNVYNALAAAAAAIAADIPAAGIISGLADFTGAGRRLEFKGVYNGADIYDDYAHHPGELRALFQAVSLMGYKRIICAFQPHTYSRVAALLDSFAEELCKPDILFLSEIYAAREQNTSGISSRDLAAKIPDALFCPDFELIPDKLRALASEGDIILTVGAGDIYKIGEALIN